MLVNACFHIDLEVKQSMGKSLQDVKITSLRDPVSATCNLVKKHMILQCRIKQ